MSHGKHGHLSPGSLYSIGGGQGHRNLCHGDLHIDSWMFTFKNFQLIMLLNNLCCLFLHVFPPCLFFLEWIWTRLFCWQVSRPPTRTPLPPREKKHHVTCRKNRQDPESPFQRTHVHVLNPKAANPDTFPTTRLDHWWWGDEGMRIAVSSIVVHIFFKYSI